jgi:hypothetical protein
MDEERAMVSISARGATALQNFDGLGQGFSGPQGTFSDGGLAPPDPHSAVGPNDTVETVNFSMAVFDS